MMMKYYILSIFFAVALPITASAQLFHSIGLGIDECKRPRSFYSQPRMHIEGDRLYVCTNKGLFAKDLNDKGGVWQIVGFDGIPLQDYARRGSDILVLRCNKGGGYLLLSHDGGRTYEDVTPDIFCHEEYETLPSLVQHPTDSNTLLVSSVYRGIYRSKDFGQTWEQLAGFLVGNSAASFIGFHPARPNIIYNSGETMFMSGIIVISYDDGRTWDFQYELGFPGDNCVHRPAFHPTNPDRWIAGGESCIYLSDDNGQTWNCQNYLYMPWDDNYGDKSRTAYWFFTAFDDEHPDTVYTVGPAGNMKDNIKLMCSTDGGYSWHLPQLMPMKKDRENVNDMLQYRDRLIIYTESGIYEVSKAELVAQSTSAIRSVTVDDENAPVYDLQGRRIKEPRHGLFIKNGRKIVK